MLVGGNIKNMKKIEEKINKTEELEKDKVKSNIDNDDLRKLLEKNIEISNELLEASKYVKGFIFWRKIISFLQILIIAVPVILALIYVPPFLENLMELINKVTGVSNLL